MSLLPGTRLGPYEILAPIGAGGMGEVYRARDSRLNRDVAIKILPALLAADPDRLARFEREAQSIAKLSHPNILNILDFGREGTVVYAAMELLGGGTLREHVTAGPLGPRKVIEYAVQVAHGLAAAHDKGMVHRDLKPENLFVTMDDRVKILDFGLAKPIDVSGSAVTVANSVGTAAGMVMGTVGYMAPEQLRGQHTDHRSDIFAFGCVLYEMVSGRRAFSGETPADTISAILNSEPPDLDQTMGGVPSALDRIVRRCLEKKPELRFQSAHDLAFALQTLPARGSGAVAATTASIAATPQRNLRTALPWAVAALALLAAAVPWMRARNTTAPEIPWQTFTAITDTAGVETAPSLSPDGSMIAYATRAGGSFDIYSQRVGGRTVVPIAAEPDRNETGPAFSPDSRLVAYYEEFGRGGIFVAGATGESARRLTDFGAHPVWAPDGKQIAFSDESILDPYRRRAASGLWVVAASGGEPSRIEGAGDACQPAWSPSGARIAFWSNTGGQRDLYTIPAGGGPRVALTSDEALDWDPEWSHDGRYLYFASDRGGSMNIWRIAVDQQTGTPLGRPEPVTTGVQAASEMPSFSKDGSRLAFRSAVTATNPVAVTIDPVTLKAGGPVVLNNSNTHRRPWDVSRDGRFLAYANTGESQEDLFVGSIDGSRIRRLTDDAARDRYPTWSGDGKTVYFQSTRGGQWEVWSIGIDGGGLRKIAGLAGVSLTLPIVSPQGDRLVSSSIGGDEMYVMPLGREGAAGKLVKLSGTKINGASLLATSWSPDGMRVVGRLVGSSGDPTGLAVYDLRTSSITQRYEVRANFVRWMPDGYRLCALVDGRFVVIDIRSGLVRQIDLALPRGHTLVAGDFGLTPDGRTILFGSTRSEADIWIVERK